MAMVFQQAKRFLGRDFRVGTFRAAPNREAGEQV
jgi:hypothetical protein